MSDKSLRTREPEDWTDEELLGDLTESFQPSEIPPCRVCGQALSVQRAGGGEPTVWACAGVEEIPGRPGHIRNQKGRRGADEHYVKSEFVDRRRGGDSRVMELVKRFQEAKKQVPHGG